MNESFERHGFRFQIASAEHGAEIARLLNDNEIPGWIRLSYQTSPGWNRPLVRSFGSASVVGVNAAGQLGGVATRSVHRAFLSGKIQPVGWLGQLRVDRTFRHRAHLLRAGFEAVERFLHDPVQTPVYYASIIEGNEPARRILERGLAGFPRFERLFDYEVIAIAAPRAGRVLREQNDLSEITSFIAAQNRDRDLAPAPEARELATDGWAGLKPEDFIVLRENGAICAVGAVWDQHPYRSIRVQGYRAPLDRMRGIMNIFGPLTRQPRLPLAGQDLRQVYLSLSAFVDDRPDLWAALTRSALNLAGQKGAALLALGFAANDPGGVAVKAAFRHRIYRSTIYRVSLTGDISSGPSHLTRPKIEIGLL